jgi:hypothetical protein
MHSRSFETRSLPTSLAATHRGPAAAGSLPPKAPLYLARSRSARPLPSRSRGCGIARPGRSIETRLLPSSLATLP